jgi:hypothetical protein
LGCAGCGQGGGAVSQALQSFAADIPPSLREADELLARFGRWAMHRHKKQRCASAEGMYPIPPNDDSRLPKEILLTDFDAMGVQRSLSKVPDVQRVVLEVLYVPRRWPVEAQMRRLRIPPRLSQDRHLVGLRMFDNIRRCA